MKTRDFIRDYLTNRTNRTNCSSVFGDGDIVYSYGYHYPLATIRDGKAWINTRGYSTTTAKHIVWAFNACAQIVGYSNIYGVDLLANNFNADNLHESLTRTAKLTIETMRTKKRKTTQIYRNLSNDLNRTINAKLALGA